MIRVPRAHAWLLCFALAATACGPQLQLPPDPDGGTLPDGGEPASGLIAHTEQDGATLSVIDATDKEKWTGLDLDNKQEADPIQDATWDLAFQRSHIRTRGGVHGSGSVAVAIVESTDFASLTHAPASGWLEDVADGADDNTLPDTAFEGDEVWYNYDVSTHLLTPKAQLYVVRTDSGYYFKLKLESYYDTAGTPATFRVRWAPVAAPEPVNDHVMVAATSSTDWVYLRVGAGVVTPTSPASSTEWDLAFKRTQIATNGGSSGTGLGAARQAGSDVFDTLTHSPTVGFVQDAATETSSNNPALANWFDYDVNTHTVTPKPLVWLLRTASGRYAKLQILSYAGGTYEVRLAPVERQVSVQSLTVDASSTETWTAVNLGLGQVVAPDTLDASHDWDLAFRRTLVRANGGTSGPADVGVTLAGPGPLESVLQAPEGPYTGDSVQAIPGSGAEGSFNTVLSDWYEYDMDTHAVSPKNAVWVVRTVDGGFGKLRVVSYGAGIFQLELAYSGPGHVTF